MNTKDQPPSISQTASYEPRKLYSLNIKELNPDPNQPRKFMDDTELQELANSIKKHGVLQPILFRQNEDGKLMIISGERRYQASLKAGLKSIPGIYTVGNTAEISLVENLLREDLNPIDEAEALIRLKEEQDYTHEQLSQIVCKAASTISEILSLNKLPKSIKDKCRTNPKVSRRSLVEIAKGDSAKEMRKRFKKYEKHNLTSDVLRETTRATRGIDAVLMTMTGGLYSKLSSVNLIDLDITKRPDIEEKLRELVQLIQEKLN